MRIDSRVLPWVAAALGAACTLMALSAPVDLRAWMDGEVDVRGTRRFDPPAPSAAVVAQIDFGLVHGELWPAWVVASDTEEPAAFEALRRAVEPDPYLVERVERTRELAKDATGNVRRLLYQVWAWNRYCDLVGVPWRLAAGVHVLGPDDADFYVKSYQVISDTPTRVGDGYWRTRVVQRVDDLSAVEGYLGLTSDHEEGALVVAERVASFALERLWPLLDDELDPERTAMDAVFAERIRQDVARGLHPTDYTVLRDTASDRFWLERAISAVHARARCGNRFQIPYLPYDGLHRRELREVRRFAAATATEPCPDVTQMEMLALVAHSKNLQATKGLRQALEALNAFASRVIAIHEARHAADDWRPGALRCSTCPPDLVAQLEASAYLASFTDEETASVALLQACAVRQVDAAGRAEAISFVVDQLGTPCETGPTDDLVERARALERTLFDRDEPVVLHPDYPAHVPLERAIRAGLPPSDEGTARDEAPSPE